jgi:hypothetical protein
VSVAVFAAKLDLDLGGMRLVGSSLTFAIIRFDDVTAAQMAAQGSNRWSTGRISVRCWFSKFESGEDGMGQQAQQSCSYYRDFRA